MPAQVGTAFIDIKPELSGFQRDVSRGVNPAIDRTGGHIRSSLGGAFRAVALTAGGLFAAIGVGRFLGGALEEARDAMRVGRETAAVLRSTGEAAGVSANEVKNWAREIGRTVGVDNDLIQDAENLLLTFREVGEDIFPDATQAIVDMTAAMNDGTVESTGLQRSTIMVGKALNDPIRGMTALTRVGVTFNDQQRDQITAMVEAGDKAGAQAIILQELQTEFGGLAEASADPFSRFGVAVDEIKEKIGLALMPALNGVANAFGGLLDVWDVAGFDGVLAVLRSWFTETLVPWLGENVPRLINWLGGVGLGALSALGGLLTWVGSWFDQTLRPWLQANVPLIPEYLAAGVNILDSWLNVTVKPWIENSLKPWLTENLPKLGDFLATSGEAILAGMDRLVNWIEQWIDSGGATRLGEAANRLFSKFIQWFWDDFNGIKAIAGVLYFLGRIVWAMGIELPNAFARAAAEAIKGFVTGAADRILGRNGQTSAVSEIIDTFKNNLGNWADVGIEWIKKAFDGLVKWARDHAPDIGDVLRGIFGALNPFGDGWGIPAGGFQDPRVGSGKIPGGGSVINTLISFLRGTGTPFGVSSTFRPGARTRSGNLSLHALGRAVDFVGPNLMAIARAFLPVAGNLKELIYTPLGFSIKNGRKVAPYAQADHFDHVHVALAKGGIVTRPTVALMGESGAEAVLPLTGGGGGLNVQVFLGTRELEDIVDVRIDGVSREAEDVLLRGLAS